MAKDANEHDSHSTAHDEHGHDDAHGHAGNDAGEIIPEKSPEDFMLTIFLSTGAFIGFCLVFYFMWTGAELKHLEPNAGPSMYVYTEGAESSSEQEDGHHHHGPATEGAHQ